MISDGDKDHDDDLPEPSGAPHPIVAHVGKLEAQLRELAQSVLRYDETIEEVARRRGLLNGSGTGAWSVDGALGERLDAQYFDLIAKARAALDR